MRDVVARGAIRAGVALVAATVMWPALDSGSAKAEERLARATQSAPVKLPDGGGSGGYVVMVSSDRSEDDALAAYRRLRKRYPHLLGTRAPLIKRADLGAHGTYYRTRVGPFESAEDAARFCGRLRAAGSPCIVQRN